MLIETPLVPIPVISPADVTLLAPAIGAGPERRLLRGAIDADYSVHQLDPLTALALPESTAAGPITPGADMPDAPLESDALSRAIAALDEVARAARLSEYHDFSWWDHRVTDIRAALELGRGTR